MKYDDMESRSLPSAAIVSLILIVLTIMALVIYLILFTDTANQIVNTIEFDNTTATDTETVPLEPSIDYHQLYIESEALREEQQMKYLEMTGKRNQEIEEYKNARDEKELEDLRTIQRLTEERDEYKRAYEELEEYVNGLVEELKSF